MKIELTEDQFKKIIRASEAYSDLESIKTLVNGKRNVSFITIASSSVEDIKKILNLINQNDLQPLYVEGNPYDAYVVYRKGAEREALELKSIAEKYGGYLSSKASEDDSRRIGQLLSYHPDDIEDYIIRNRTIRNS